MTRIACCQPVLLLTTLCAVTAASPLIESEPQTVTRTNRLSQESSPYLLLHAHNPVDWYPWGPEALEKAAQRISRSFCQSDTAVATGVT
jgi:hypothetical protein